MPLQDDEKRAFAERLKLALKRSKKKIETPTDLALQFNLRHRNEAITPQAAQKWLSGKSRPTIDKINTLALWLNVSAQWLRHGIPESKPTKPAKSSLHNTASDRVALNEGEQKLITRLRNMPEHRRLLVLEIVEQFSVEQEIWQS
jgi:transcriptional regulator with XRE-family HTH domain